MVQDVSTWYDARSSSFAHVAAGWMSTRGSAAQGRHPVAAHCCCCCCRLPQVHAWNVLRMVFNDSSMSLDSSGFHAAGVAAAIQGMAAPEWEVRARALLPCCCSSAEGQSAGAARLNGHLQLFWNHPAQHSNVVCLKMLRRRQSSFIASWGDWLYQGSSKTSARHHCCVELPSVTNKSCTD